VYRAGADGKVTVIEKELTRPNGVALSPDERTLYVGQSEGTKAIINAYTLDANGNVTSKKLFHDTTDLVSDAAPGAPDGLTVAADGTVFTSGPGGILVLSKDGKRLGRIWDGKQTANCKFGDDGQTLYMTSSNFVARIRLEHQGRGFLTTRVRSRGPDGNLVRLRLDRPAGAADQLGQDPAVPGFPGGLVGGGGAARAAGGQGARRAREGHRQPARRLLGIVCIGAMFGKLVPTAARRRRSPWC
jgi:hypothetical protein